jgi:hypothetical protein
MKILPVVFEKTALYVKGNSLNNSPYFLEQNVGIYRALTYDG